MYFNVVMHCEEGPFKGAKHRGTSQLGYVSLHHVTAQPTVVPPTPLSFSHNIAEHRSLDSITVIHAGCDAVFPLLLGYCLP